MIYITKEDLETDSIDRFIDESTGFDDNIINKAEEKVIAFCSTFLTRYDLDDTFDSEDPIRDEFLVDVMSKILQYRIFSRNKARKVTTNVKENYEWALKQLEKIQTGKITLSIPPRITEQPDSLGPIIYGSFSNSDYYI